MAALFITLSAGGQHADTSFYRHLEEQKLLREQNAWWQENQSSKYQLRRNSAGFLLEKAAFAEFFELLGTHTDLVRDSCLTELASQQFLLIADPIRRQWFGYLEKQGVSIQTSKLYSLAQDENLRWLPTFDSRIYPSFEAMRSAQKKKMSVAISLDIVLPGAGKAYLGMPRHGFQTAFVMALLGWATAESIQRTGPKSVLSYLNYSALGTIYLANIFGTAYHHKTRRINYEQSYFNEVYKYASLYSCD